MDWLHHLNNSQDIKSERIVFAEKFLTRAIFFPTQSIRYSGNLVGMEFHGSPGIMMKVVPDGSIFGGQGCYSSSCSGKTDKTKAS